MCGSSDGTAVCDACGHQFCKDCRGRYFTRGIAAVKEMLGVSKLRCASMAKRFQAGGY